MTLEIDVDEVVIITPDADWNGKDEARVSVNSGLYFYKLEAGATSKIKKKKLLR